jgi:hypothetical protein
MDVENSGQIENLHDVFRYTGDLIKDVYDARNIFFEEKLRKELYDAYQEFQDQFNEVLKGIEGIEKELDLRAAGLAGAQKNLKLKSFELSYNAYRSEGRVRRLIEALKKGKTIISSLAGLVPKVGSFIQEFVDFVLRQLEREH